MSEEDPSTMDHDDDVEVGEKRKAGGGGPDQGQNAGPGGNAADEDDGGFNRTDRLLRYPLGSAQRYYTTHYLVDVGGNKGHDQYLYEHPNGLFIVGLVKTHAALVHARSAGLSAEKVEYHGSENGKGGKGISGKKKRGALHVTPGMTLASVHFPGQPPVKVSCGVDGQLLEANGLVMREPKTILEESEGRAFVGIIQPLRWRPVDRTPFLTPEAYAALRASPAEETSTS